MLGMPFCNSSVLTCHPLLLKGWTLYAGRRCLSFILQ